MKNLIFAFIFSVVGIGHAQTEELKTGTKRAVATYTGNSTNGYYFINDLDESTMLFNQVNPDVMKKYDLANKSYIRETFRVYYKVERNDGKKRLTIVNLELLEYDKS
jgi:hypothetical protein